MSFARLHAVALASVLVSALPVAATLAATPRPNIILFYVDDLPQRGLGSREAFFHTPNIDSLTERGITFANSFVTSPVCAVSRAGLLTGQQQARHGIGDFDTPLSAEQLDASFFTKLRRSGYKTAYLGKFGVGHPRSHPKELCLPEDRFDLWYGFIQGSSYSQIENGEKRHITSIMEDKAIAFMENDANRPFFILMALLEPHGQGGPGGPWNYQDPAFEVPPPAAPPLKPVTMTKEAFEALPEAIRNSRNNQGKKTVDKLDEYMETVRAFTARADLAVGRMLEAVERLGLADNTVVIFTSDNGSMWGAKRLAGKWNLYEESIRVPMIVMDPRLKDQRGVREQLVSNLDIAPTVLGLAGLEASPDLQGHDLMTYIKDANAAGPAYLFLEHDTGSESDGKPLPRVEGVRTAAWKYAVYKDTDPAVEELFDLAADPVEAVNLVSSSEHTARLVEMRELFAKAKAEAR
jgi:arylsulfatase A-like enzyme